MGGEVVAEGKLLNAFWVSSNEIVYVTEEEDKNNTVVLVNLFDGRENNLTRWMSGWF